MAKRKILIVTNRVPFPLNDGGNLAMHAMIEGYQKAGWQVSLLSMNTTRHYVPEKQLEKLFGHLHSFEWVNVDNRLRWTEIAKNFLLSDQPEHAMRFYRKDFKDILISTLQKLRPDVIQVESVYLSTYLPVIKEYSDGVTVLRLHNIEYQIWGGLANRTGNWLKKLYFDNLTERIRNFERAAWRSYDLLLPITEKDALLVERLETAHHMVVAPFSIDMHRIRKGTNEKWVGYHIGAMDWIPNRQAVQWFISKAWPRIRRVCPDFEFHFAGRSMPAEFKTQQVDGVYCHDEVPDADDFIADKKILIVPIETGGGIRTKILEAMAAAKVVISTESGIKGIDAKAGDHFLLAKKPEEFAGAIKWCLENKQAATEMGERGRKLIRDKYDCGTVITQVIDALEAIMIAHKPASGFGAS